MFSAIDINNHLVDITTAIKHPYKKYLCCSCKSELIIKNGTVRIPHFAHKSKCECDGYDNDMSEWHRNWQKRFPLKNREVVLHLNHDSPYHNNYKYKTRRADVLCYGYAIEFQNSLISSEEFDERNSFYNQLGYKVVWMFNMIDLYEDNLIECYDEWDNGYDNGGKFSWKYASKTLINYDSNNKNIIIFFQFTDFSNNIPYEDQIYLERITWAINSNNSHEDTDFKRFCTSYYPGTLPKLMDNLQKRSL